MEGCKGLLLLSVGLCTLICNVQSVAIYQIYPNRDISQRLQYLRQQKLDLETRLLHTHVPMAERYIKGEIDKNEAIIANILASSGVAYKDYLEVAKQKERLDQENANLKKKLEKEKENLKKQLEKADTTRKLTIDRVREIQEMCERDIGTYKERLDALTKEAKRTAKEYAACTEKLIEQKEGTATKVNKLLKEKEETVQKLKAETEERVQKLNLEKEETKQKLKSEKEEAVQKLKAEKEAAVQKLKAEKEQTVQTLKAETEKRVQKLNVEKEETKQKLQSEKEKAVQKLKAEKEETVQKLKAEKEETVQKLKAEKNQLIIATETLSQKLNEAQNRHSWALEAMSVISKSDDTSVPIPYQDEINEFRHYIQFMVKKGKHDALVSVTKDNLKDLLQKLYEEGKLQNNTPPKELQNLIDEVEISTIQLRKEQKRDLQQKMKDKDLQNYNGKETAPLRLVNQAVEASNEFLQELARRKAYLKAILQVGELLEKLK